MSRAVVLAVVCAAVLVWQGAAVAVDSPVLPSPVDVLQSDTDGLAADAWQSLSRVLVGYLFAAVLSVTLGSAAALSGSVGRGVRALVNGLRPIPPIAWVPLAILWFGLGDGSAWFIVFIGAFFPVFVQVAWALGRPPAKWLELAASVGASPSQTFWSVRLPAAAPGIAAGLRTGLGLAWTSVIAAELVGAQSGLGYRIQLHRLMLETDAVVAGMLIIGVLGFGMDRLARLVEKRLVPWETP
ncbi:MAG: ABC transporter permease [Proteobacteria bacterium]|nr:ABC transporter permease [Pseudomonadota bacterium]MCP4921043.1 ABC transporter permease [Pseudomonadota bacterium]